MELIILLLVGAGMWWFIRRLDKSPKRSIPLTRPPNVSKLGTFQPGLRPVKSAPPAQQNPVDDVLPSFALGAVTGLPIGRNLAAGVVGAALYEPDVGEGRHAGDRHTQDRDDATPPRVDEGTVQSTVGDDSGGSSSGGDGGSSD